MATRQENITAIRTAVYGKDVREAIADALEQTYDACGSFATAAANSAAAAADSASSAASALPLDTALSTAGKAADAKAVGDAIAEGVEVVNEISEEAGANLFALTSVTKNGVTLTVAADGTLDFDGTATASTNFIVEGSPLAAGTYAAKSYLDLGGTISDGTKITLRTRTSVIGDSTAPASTTRWLDKSHPELSGSSAMTFSDPVYVCVNITSGTTLSHYKCRYQIEAGTSLGDFTPGGLTAVDSTARARLTAAESAITAAQAEIAAARAVRYVSPSGSDSSDGRTRSTPFATIAKAITDGADLVVLAAGTYTENVYVTYRNLTILGYGATIQYDTSNSARINVLDLRTGFYKVLGVRVVVDAASAETNHVNGIKLHNANGELTDCTVDGGYQGFWFYGSVSKAVRCAAANCLVDGFNGHDSGTAVNDGTFIDCVATGCGDDGLSYHEEGSMHVLGGEYAGNGSTGIAPHNNCNCDIVGAYIHDNGRAGIEARVGNYTTPDPLPTMVLSGCIIADNTGNAVTAEHYVVEASANGFGGNGTDGIVDGGGSTITSYAAAGDELSDLRSAIDLGSITPEVKTALLACFENVAWKDEHGQDYYDALEAALYPPVDLVSISAVYTQSGTVYDTDSLDSLKSDLVVTATYNDSSTAVVTAYTLSGTLTEGTSTITVSYGGKTTTFSVTVTVSRETIFGVFAAGYTSAKSTSGQSINNIWRMTAAARAVAPAPVQNNGYVFTVTDSSKYNLAAYDVTSLDHTTAVPTTSAVDGYGYVGGTKTVAWATTDSVTTPYVWLALKKMDGSAFTDAELANGAEAVFTYTTS